MKKKLVLLLVLVFTLVVSPNILLAQESLIPENKIIITTRIGVKYAGSDALLPYRFLIDKETIKNYLK